MESGFCSVAKSVGESIRDASPQLLYSLRLIS